METLKTFRENNDEIHSLSASLYKQELNELKIEKLGNRITIISFILPCLIGAVLLYAYMDINHRVVDAKDSGQSEIQQITQEMESKINAMNVEMARLKFNQEQQFPAITARIEELSQLKADREETLASLKTLEKEMAHTADQYKAAIHIIDRTSKENLAIINDTGDRIKKDVQAFEETATQRLTTIETRFNESLAALETAIKKDLARMETLNLSLASYEMTIKTLGKDLAETKSNFNQQLQQTISRNELESVKKQLQGKTDRKTLTAELDKLRKNIDAQLKQLENASRAQARAGGDAAAESVSAAPPRKQSVSSQSKKSFSPEKEEAAPPIITVPEPGKISEMDLTQ